MLESLVVGGVEEDLRLQAAPCVAIVHDLPATGLVPASVQCAADIVHSHVCKGRCITLLAHTCCDLQAEQSLFQTEATSVPLPNWLGTPKHQLHHHAKISAQDLKAACNPSACH